MATENDLVASAWVGRYKMKDVNNDGKIDASDRTFIGNPHPDLTGGINLGVNWKGFDLSTYMYFSVAMIYSPCINIIHIMVPYSPLILKIVATIHGIL